MNFCERQQALDALKVIGRLRCAYAGDWPDNFCDCKFGGPKLQDHPDPKIGAFSPVEVYGEQTGCPELRSIYAIIDFMSNDAWDRFSSDLFEQNLQEYKKLLEENDGD